MMLDLVVLIIVVSLPSSTTIWPRS